MSCFFSSANLASFFVGETFSTKDSEDVSSTKTSSSEEEDFCQRLELVVTFCQRLCTGGIGGCSSAGLLFIFFQSFCAFFQRLFSRLSFAMLACWHPGGVLGLGHLLVLPGRHTLVWAASSLACSCLFFQSPWQLASWPVWPWR